MITFFTTLRRLLKALFHAGKDSQFRALAYLSIVFLISGSLFYSAIEGWSLVDSLYFCVMTMTTIGYGDLVPSSDFSKIFTVLYAFSSIGIFVALAARLATEMLKPKHHFHKGNKDAS